MRKCLTLLMAGLFIAGLAVSVNAAELQTSGFYRIGFDLSNNQDDFRDNNFHDRLTPPGTVPPGTARVSGSPGSGTQNSALFTRPRVFFGPNSNEHADDNSLSYVQSRFGYNLAWVTDKNLKAVLSIEVDDGFGVWGGEPSGGKAVAGLGGSIGQFRTDDNVGLEVKNAYMEFLIPNTPVTAKIGPQTYFIGQYGNFLLVDAAGITLTADLKPYLLSAFTYKIREGKTGGADDTDMYGGWFRGTTSGINLQAWGMFQNQNSPTDGDAFVRPGRPEVVACTRPSGSVSGGTDVNQFAACSKIGAPTAAIERIIAVVDSNIRNFVDINSTFRGASNAETGSALTPTTVGGTGGAVNGIIRKADLWWLGTSGETKFGPWSIFGNAIWSHVDADLFTNNLVNTINPTGVRSAGEFKTDGLLLDAIVGYQLGTMTLQVEGLWTSQIDLREKEPNFFFTPFTEAAALSDKGIVFFAPIWDYAVGRTNFSFAGESAYTGIWLARAALTMPVPAIKGLTTKLNFVWIGDNVKNGDMYGDFGNSSATFGINGDDKTIGQEVDLSINYPIYKNLVLDAGFGYLFAGNALDGFNNGTVAAGTLQRAKADDAWVAAARLMYTF